MQNTTQQLSGKIAIVTGAASGVGAGIARRFAAEGARVMLHDVDAAVRETAAAIRDAGGDADAVVSDLADPRVPAELIDAVAKRYGAIHILVNNAALIVRADAETTDVATWDRVMAVNVRAPFLLFKAALPYLRANGGGAVLNIGSMNAYCGQPNMMPYCVSKGALMTLTRNLADGHGRDNIRVNQLNLGWTITENEHRYKLAEGKPEDWAEHLPAEHAPLGRLMTPAEVAHFALSFVVDSACMVSGSVTDLTQHPIIGRNPVK
ncbi:MAG: SDR family oxidoreductase [Capsulimonadaceae bacterium]|nr:SDR family oxidoreductase [Capsulimonadaceae bacterium]